MGGTASGLSAAACVAAGRPVLVHSFEQWREAARELLAHKVPPHAVQWISHKDDGDLFAQGPLPVQPDLLALDGPGGRPAGGNGAIVSDGSGSDGGESSPDGQDGGDTVDELNSAAGEDGQLGLHRRHGLNSVPRQHGQPQQSSLGARDGQGGPPGAGRLDQPALRVSRQLMEMLQSAACCRVPNRWAFLYLVLWRWQHGEKEVLSAADEDGARLHGMVKAVRREEHDMHAYIRFRERREEAGAPRFVAWFEPAHDVLPQVARHFSSRMGRVTWMIATPEASVMWDGATLHSTGPLMRGPEDIDDAGEALWLTYYRSIFNPARLNADLMHGHIPTRFWKNLPEGAVVPEMVSQAAAGARKVGQTGSVGRRSGTVIPISAEKVQPEREAPSTLDQCRRCELWKHATQAVPGVGPGGARIMMVGEQPGDQEDLAGLPFVGPAGQLLDRALGKAEVERREVYLTNAVKHFKWEPRGKRRMHKTPAQREVDACSFWLEGELERVQPDVVVALGSTALKSITGNPHATLKDVLGQPFRHQGRWVVVIYHPSYVLRVPGEEAKAQAFGVMVDGLRQAQALLAAPVVAA